MDTRQFERQNYLYRLSARCTGDRRLEVTDQLFWRPRVESIIRLIPMLGCCG
jgi:hypothetical protein